uniref:Uncharacterized protein n=1 Tax=Oryza barthii TaxID=65489 RepID=A0A0D3FR58_9ORYZ
MRAQCLPPPTSEAALTNSGAAFTIPVRVRPRPAAAPTSEADSFHSCASLARTTSTAKNNPCHHILSIWGRTLQAVKLGLGAAAGECFSKSTKIHRS